MDENGNPLPPAEDLNLCGGDEPASTGEQSTPQPAQPAPATNQQEQDAENEQAEIARDPVVPPVGEEEQGGEAPVSRRENKRIGQLLEKFQSREQELLARTTGRQPQPSATPTPQRTPGQPIIPDGEYTTEEVNQMARDYGESLLQQGLSQVQAVNIANNFANRLEIDLPKVTSKYEFLDEQSDNFNPGPAEFINRLYLNTVGYNPINGTVQDTDLRYSEFVEGFMDVLDLISNGKLADATASVASQAAGTGPRPSGNAKTPLYQGDDPKQMTDEQLDAAIAQGLGIRK